MRPFRYRKPASLAEAVALLQGDPDSRLLAGGQSLLPALRLGLAEPSALVDLAALRELQSIAAMPGAIRIGAMARHAMVAESALVMRQIPALSALAGGIGDRQIRSVGTIGGSLANNDPSACYPAAALGLDATLHTDRRAIAAQDFFSGLYQTALEPDEIICHIDLAIPLRAAYVKFPQPASKFALAGVFVALFGDGVRVAITGASRSGVYRDAAMEECLNRQFSPKVLEHCTVEPQQMLGDLHAPADYRAHLVRVAAMRAVEQLLPSRL
ncbi:MAG: FAD binding domain-containing protein [Steroidobacterales bacterium]